MYYWCDKEWDWSSKDKTELKKTNDVQNTDDTAKLQEQEIDYPTPSFPMPEEDVKLDFSSNPARTELQANDKSNGNPIMHCEYIGGDYDEWKQALIKPFISKGGCDLS